MLPFREKKNLPPPGFTLLDHWKKLLKTMGCKTATKIDSYDEARVGGIPGGNPELDLLLPGYMKHGRSLLRFVTCIQNLVCTTVRKCTIL